MSLPTIEEYKAALREMDATADTGAPLPSDGRTFRVARNGVEQAILFQDAWGAELADVQVLLGHIRTYFDTLWHCTPATFERERLKVSQWWQQLNEQLARIEAIEYSP